jgi:hypothetical protein
VEHAKLVFRGSDKPVADAPPQPQLIPANLAELSGDAADAPPRPE